MQGDTLKNFIVKYKNILIFAGFCVGLAIIIVLVFLSFQLINRSGPNQEDLTTAESDTKTQTEEEKKLATLPEGEERNNGDINGNGEYDGWEVEKFSFGDFYTQKDIDWEVNLGNLALPINVKVDVANYHDVNRKIDLEAGLASLNNYGFALLDNPFASEADNFYSMHDLLNEKQLPTLITADFLMYYFQNNLKLVFKEVEGTTFYDNLWQTNLKLYNIAKTRYEKHRAETGIVNDPTLEAERLELAFLATTLSLLQPKEGQVSRSAGLDTDNMFSQSELDFYSFQLPGYLEDDIAKELALIADARGSQRSPVLLYEQDYQKFKVKKEYKQSARLNNFYLASLWLNSLFPLYYQGEFCPDCLLDIDDWRINFYAAVLLSKDFSDNQDLQNSWAKIYKLMSFFDGLKGDLTYLHYAEVFNNLYGQDKTPAEVFAHDQDEIDQKLFAMQEKLLELDFLDIEGALNKDDLESRKLLGMKMLSESFWPDQYINQQFVYPTVGSHLEQQFKELDQDLVKTACSIKNQTGAWRCYPSAYDVVNLMYPLENISQSFAVNSLFEHYDQSRSKLLAQLQNFSVNSWHSNTFWSSLDIADKFLNSPDEHRPFYAKNDLFKSRQADTVASALLNSGLEADTLTTYQETARSSLDSIGGENKFFEYRYIEPEAVLVSELLANTEMLLDMFALLEITERDNGAIIILNEMRKRLESSLAIIAKELKGEALNEDDYKFIDAFAREYSLKTEGNKENIVTTEQGRAGLKQSIDGIKLLLIIYQKEGKNIFAVGPVFNFSEKVN